MICPTAVTPHESTPYPSTTPATGSIIDEWFLPRGWQVILIRCHVCRGLGMTQQAARGVPPWRPCTYAAGDTI
eukprot:4608786-Pyramimonas_sp.AAC.1